MCHSEEQSDEESYISSDLRFFARAQNDSGADILSAPYFIQLFFIYITSLPKLSLIISLLPSILYL